MNRYVCEFCGMDFLENEVDSHRESFHSEEIEKEKEELETILRKKELELEHKAKMYDNLVVKALMSCGVIESKGETKFIVEPETFTDVVLSEILADINIDREIFINDKRKMINELRGVNEQGN